MSSDTDILNDETITTLHEILGDDFKPIISDFIKIVPEQIVTLKKAAECGDIELVASVTHSIKGSSGNVGAMYLSDKCQVLEHGVRDNVIQDTEKYIQEIEMAFDVTLAELKKRFY